MIAENHQLFFKKRNFFLSLLFLSLSLLMHLFQAVQPPTTSKKAAVTMTPSVGTKTTGVSSSVRWLSSAYAFAYATAPRPWKLPSRSEFVC